MGIGNIIDGVVITMLASYMIKVGVATTKPFIDNKDIMPEVAKELTVNYKTLQSDAYNNQIVRLKPNIDNIIWVYIDKDISKRTKTNIRNTLKYFNNIMEDINQNYNFVEFGKVFYTGNSILYNSVINFKYGTLGSSNYGLSSMGPNKPFIAKSIDGYYNRNVYNMRNKIYFDKVKFEELSDFTQTGIIRHEMLHILGLQDTYYGYAEEASLMNVAYTSIINEISPSDLRKLYVMYDEKLKLSKNTINQEELLRVKTVIRNYEDVYYNKIVNRIMRDNKTLSPLDISDEELVNYSTTTAQGIEISIDDNGMFTYSYKDGKYTGTREIVKGKNYVILPDVSTKNEEDYYIILKDENGLYIKNAYTYGPNTSEEEEQLRI